ncbi:MAG: ribonucleoside-diphosphate reductase subunit alpha [bacterium]|nr:ribonucleoside-diphosphate reductase subunit alpha [bacterium]
MTNIMIKHRDGSMEPYDADKINRSIERACVGLNDPISMVTQIASETELTLYNGITTEDLDQATISAAVQNIKDDPDYDKAATRLLLKTNYKKVLGDFNSNEEFIDLHRSNFISYIKNKSLNGILDKRFTGIYDLELLASALKPQRDELFRYIGLTTILKRYAIRGEKQELLELPQYTWMRIAMGLALPEQNPTKWAINFYNKLSQLHYISGGSTNVNAGTRLPQMSNCYVMEMQDNIDHIAKTVSDVMKLTKATGGIGLSVTKLRAEGSPVRSNNTFSSGPIPFMHTIDSTLRAVSRAGKKMGALCFYMENWHYNFAEFLDLKQNAGDEYRRTRTANTSVYISDEFMKRVKNNDDWYLFDPAETADLNELYGAAFSAAYNEYVRKAEAGKLNMFKKIKAREQFKSIMIMLQTASHPWITFKDSINVRALNNNTGTIHLSNLCTEICLPQDKNNIAVCNLASINLSQHFADSDEIDWALMEESVRTAIRQLDNLLDVNKSPIPETQNSDKNNRAIGLGIMGFTDIIQRKSIAYDSADAYNLIDKIMEFVSYVAIDTSADLAQERGSYPNFTGSRWSEGLVPIDTIDILEKDRGVEIKINRGINLNWDALRQKVKKGMRNATLMAIAPTANIGLVAGTTPGIDPQFSNIFARATNRGKFLEVNVNLINDLKKLNLWEEVKEEILSRQGEINDIKSIPQHIKDIYKTSFQLDPKAFIEVASRAQKWIDQAISRNMYLTSRDIEETMGIYEYGWDKGLKTFYYLHMKQRHTAEQSTSRVNKSEQIAGGRSFGFGRFKGGFTGAASLPAAEESAAAGPISIPAAEPQPAVASVAAQMADIMKDKNTAQVEEKNSEPGEVIWKFPEPALANSGPVKVGDTDKNAVNLKPAVDACPIDPIERLQCDSCQ